MWQLVCKLYAVWCVFTKKKKHSPLLIFGHEFELSKLYIIPLDFAEYPALYEGAQIIRILQYSNNRFYMSLIQCYCNHQHKNPKSHDLCVLVSSNLHNESIKIGEKLAFSVGICFAASSGMVHKYPMCFFWPINNSNISFSWGKEKKWIWKWWFRVHTSHFSLNHSHLRLLYCNNVSVYQLYQLDVFFFFFLFYHLIILLPFCLSTSSTSNSDISFFCFLILIPSCNSDIWDNNCHKSDHKWIINLYRRKTAL